MLMTVYLLGKHISVLQFETRVHHLYYISGVYPFKSTQIMSNSATGSDFFHLKSCMRTITVIILNGRVAALNW